MISYQLSAVFNQKQAVVTMVYLLSIIINNSLAMGLVPDMAKLAKIIPIYKAKDKKDISNYRPISLLPIISKILEKVFIKMCILFLRKTKSYTQVNMAFEKIDQL